MVRLVCIAGYFLNFSFKNELTAAPWLTWSWTLDLRKWKWNSFQMIIHILHRRRSLTVINTGHAKYGRRAYRYGCAITFLSFRDAVFCHCNQGSSLTPIYENATKTASRRRHISHCIVGQNHKVKATPFQSKCLPGFSSNILVCVCRVESFNISVFIAFKQL